MYYQSCDDEAMMYYYYKLEEEHQKHIQKRKFIYQILKHIKDRKCKQFQEKRLLAS